MLLTTIYIIKDNAINLCRIGNASGYLRDKLKSINLVRHVDKEICTCIPKYSKQEFSEKIIHV